MAQTSETVTDPILVVDRPRGIIEKLAEGNFKTILRITSKADTVGANHYHKTDTHICYLAKGKYEYYTRPAGDPSAPIEKILITQGQLVYTPSMLEHAMHFLEDSELYCFSTIPQRDHAAYEGDTVRVELYPPRL
jgi:quercetin dioxygenase-like cupin family protein